MKVNFLRVDIISLINVCLPNLNFSSVDIFKLRANLNPSKPMATLGSERLVLNEIFHFFLKNKQISSNQSGFKPGSSCVNQPLETTHDIY